MIDPDGNIVRLWNYVKNDEVKKGVSQKMQRAMVDFMKTEEGYAFIAQFAKKGDKIFGYEFKTDGKFSNKILDLTEVSMSEETANILTNYEGLYSVKEDKSGVVLYIPTFGDRTSEGITEIVMHEALLHGYKVDKDLSGKHKTTQNSVDADHKAIRDKNTNHSGYKKYDAARKQLEKISAKFKQIFKEAEAFYKRNYKDLK